MRPAQHSGLLAATDARTRIIPGHGPLSTRGELQRYRDMLARSIAAVKPLVAKGSTLSEVVAARRTTAFDSHWGKGFWKPKELVTMLYRSLGGKQPATTRDTTS